MVRVLIVDDEPLARDVIRGLLASMSDRITLVGEARSGHECLQLVQSLAPDLVFLDVQLPDMSAFDILASLPAEKRPAIVFVTAFDSYAVRAFEENAWDYLVKPFSDRRFALTVERALARVEEGGRSAPASALRSLVATTGRHAIRIDMEGVRWIEADDYYARLHTERGAYLVRATLNSLEQRLNPSHFVRVHRRAIVQLSFVDKLVKAHDGWHVELKDGTRVEISSRRLAFVREKILVDAPR